MAQMGIKDKRSFLAQIQAKRDRAWRAIEESQEQVQDIARHGVDDAKDRCLAHQMAKLVSLELFARQAIRQRIDRGELDGIDE